MSVALALRCLVFSLVSSGQKYSTVHLIRRRLLLFINLKAEAMTVLDFWLPRLGLQQLAAYKITTKPPRV